MAIMVVTMSDLADNPCLACGACCKTYRVSFYWAEAEERGLPDAFVERVTPHISCMAGTNARSPHCLALGTGDSGPHGCAIYPQRPDPCREVQPGDEKCQRARRHHGLPPFPT
jgi:Fe-S-cluster containining protein